MSYVRMTLNASIPAAVRKFIEGTIEDLYFSDVHAMLRLPLADKGIIAGQNFAITQVLMAVTSSVSVTLYATRASLATCSKKRSRSSFRGMRSRAKTCLPRLQLGLSTTCLETH